MHTCLTATCEHFISVDNGVITYKYDIVPHLDLAGIQYFVVPKITFQLNFEAAEEHIRALWVSSQRDGNEMPEHADSKSGIICNE